MKTVVTGNLASEIIVEKQNKKIMEVIKTVKS